MIRVHPWPGGWCVDVYPPDGSAPFVGAGPYDSEGYAEEEATKWRAAVVAALHVGENRRPKKTAL
jgi:hypothetical protein